MNPLVEIWERPAPVELYMIAGWEQWADAGGTSSALPSYLISQLQAEKIGEIHSEGFYLFQVPGTHHLFRPEVKLEHGRVANIESWSNELYYAGDENKGLLIFLGTEPQANAEEYTAAFLDIVEELGVRKTVALGGVYGATPYDQEREISCVYSVPGLKQELEELQVRFSDYEGGATIGALLVSRAEARELALVDLYAFVPAYDFSEVSDVLDGIRIEHDFKAWYDLMRRINYLFGMSTDLSDLAAQSDALVAAMDGKIAELEEKLGEPSLRHYLAELASDFNEQLFMPLDDVWERELGDLFDDMED
jgi:predicted ATP-grasp superfamily ATP-dependent carboligase